MSSLGGAGAQASDQLREHFQELSQSKDHFALLVTIDKGSLVPLRFLTPPGGASPDKFYDHIDTVLAPELEEKEPLFALVRRNEGPNEWCTVVAYIPDGTTPKKKMPFSMSHNNLMSKLGSQHFAGKVVHVASLKDVNGKEFRKQEEHEAQEAPLTEEERTLGEVKRAEQEAGRGTSSGQTNIGGAGFDLDSGAVSALEELKTGRTMVMLVVNVKSERVELAPGSASSPSSISSISDLVAVIPKDQPRFIFFRYSHTHKGASKSPLLFFYMIPEGSVAPKDRMMYALSRTKALAMAQAVGRTDAEHGAEDKIPVFDVNGVDEITEKLVQDELYPVVDERKPFSRPKPAFRRSKPQVFK